MQRSLGACTIINRTYRRQRSLGLCTIINRTDHLVYTEYKVHYVHVRLLIVLITLVYPECKDHKVQIINRTYRGQRSLGLYTIINRTGHSLY